MKKRKQKQKVKKKTSGFPVALNHTDKKKQQQPNIHVPLRPTEAAPPSDTGGNGVGRITEPCITHRHARPYICCAIVCDVFAGRRRKERGDTLTVGSK